MARYRSAPVRSTARSNDCSRRGSSRRPNETMSTVRTVVAVTTVSPDTDSRSRAPKPGGSRRPCGTRMTKDSFPGESEMSDRDWLYRLVLQVYPPAFRGSFAREMLLVHRDQRRDGIVGARYWMAVVADALKMAPKLWFEELRDGLLATEAGVKA